MRIENLGSEEKDIVLRWFLYHLPMGGAGSHGDNLVEVAKAAQQLTESLPADAGGTVERVRVALRRADRREGDLTNATRYEFMRQYPAIYNKLAGSEVVRVIHVSTGDPA